MSKGIPSPERDAEIMRRRDAGESYNVIALAMGITPKAASSAVGRVKERAGRAAAVGRPQVRVDIAGLVESMDGNVETIQPRLRLLNGRWECEGAGSKATGADAKEAMRQWRAAVNRAAAVAKRHAEAAQEKEQQEEKERHKKATEKERIAPPRTATPWRNLVIPPFLRRQQARASAVQPPLKSMASTVHGIWVTEL